MPVKYGTKEWEEEYQKVVRERRKSHPKSIAGTPEWGQIYGEIVDGDAEYKAAAKTWEGALTLVIQAKPEVGLDEDISVVLDLWHGDCRSVKILPKEEAAKAPYVMTGSLDTWEAVAKGKTDAIKATMLGKIKLKGNMANVVKHVKAAKRLADCTGLFESVWPDELSKDEIKKFRADLKQFREQFGV
jgi:putative sterol carrier protein